jgi:hypothetical protein
MLPWLQWDTAVSTPAGKFAVPGLRTESKGDTENDQDVLISLNKNENLTKVVTVPARMRSSRKSCHGRLCHGQH